MGLSERIDIILSEMGFGGDFCFTVCIFVCFVFVVVARIVSQYSATCDLNSESALT